jgi:hypothetical protein
LDAEGSLHRRDVDDFDLTLVARPKVSPTTSLHFGIRLADAESVRRLRARLAQEEVQTGEIFESDGDRHASCGDGRWYRGG